MTTQKDITLQVNPSIVKTQLDFETNTPPQDCDINIRVADGWAVTGHYRNQVLQTVRLQKTSSEEKI